MLSKEKAREIVKKLQEYAKSDLIVSIYDNGEKLTRFANSEIHQNVETLDTVVSLKVHDGKKTATCQANAYDDESLKKLARDAEEMLAHAPEGEFEVIPPIPADIPETPNDKRLAEKFDIKGRADAVKRCVGTLPADYTAAGVLSLDTSLRVFANRQGVFQYCGFNSVSFEAVVTHKDGDTGFGELMTNCVDNCEIDAAFRTAYNKAKQAVGPVYADIGSYTVILEPAAVGDLLRFMAFGLNGARYQKGLGFAAGRLGEKLFGENITIRDDVNNPAAFRRYFDGEGNLRKPVTLVENGVLKNVLYCANTAKKAGVEPTGHAFSSGGDGGYPLNIVMEGGDSTLDELIASVKKGILVTHFHYCNTVNPKTLQVTGLTRDGTFMVENGRVTTPLRNMRFTESLLNAFSNVTMMTKELYSVPLFAGPALLPAVVIENFHFTSGQK